MNLETIARIGGSNLDLYAERRRRPRSPIGKGKEERSLAAIAAARQHTVICRTPDCAALLDWSATRRQIIARHKHEGHDKDEKGTWQSEPGDGCSSCRCTSIYRPEQHLPRQMERIKQVERGERMLVEWPACLEARVEYRLNAEAAARAVKRARIALALDIASDNHVRRAKGKEKWCLRYLQPPKIPQEYTRALPPHPYASSPQSAATPTKRSRSRRRRSTASTSS